MADYLLNSLIWSLLGLLIGLLLGRTWCATQGWRNH